MTCRVSPSSVLSLTARQVTDLSEGFRRPAYRAVMQFRTEIELGGKTATGIVVPDDVVSELGSSKRPAVVVTIGSYSYRSTIGRMGGRFMVPLSAEQRTGARGGGEGEIPRPPAPRARGVRGGGVGV